MSSLEDQLRRALRDAWNTSSDENWIPARLGWATTSGGTTTYDLTVTGKPGWFYVSVGYNGDVGRTTAYDAVGVLQEGWIGIRMRRENGHLVIREAEKYAANAAPPTDLESLTDVDLTSPANGQTLQYNASTGQWVNVVPPGGAGGAPSPHFHHSVHHQGLLPWADLDKTGSSLLHLASRNHADLQNILPDQHHNQHHNIVGSDHTVTGSQYQVVGLTNTNTLGLLNSSSNPGATSAILRTDATGAVFIGTNLLAVTPSNQKVVIDTTLAVFDGLNNISTFGGANIFNGSVTTNANVTVNNGQFRVNTDPQIYADIDFMGDNRSITGSNDVTLAPTQNLRLDPGGLVAYPTSQESRSDGYSGSITGIVGFRIWDNNFPTNAMQLTINSILADNLYARKFTVDEWRVSRGAQVWSKSFGIVESQPLTTIPAAGGTIDVWFEEAPDLAGLPLFADAEWLQFRTIDVGTGLLTQTIWFQVVSQSADGYITREAQVPGSGTTQGHLARQKWQLMRRSGGFTGMHMSKGDTAVDFGLPGSGGAIGQGAISLSALKEDGGPYIQIETFDHVSGTSPNLTPVFKTRTRMGNLGGTVDYTQPAWGFAAGDDLTQVVGGDMSDFSGVTIDAVQGGRFFNTDLTLFSTNIPVVKLQRTYGLDFRMNSVFSGFDPLRLIGWQDDLNAPVTPGQPGSAYLSGFRANDSGGLLTRGMKMEVFGATGLSEQTALYFTVSPTSGPGGSVVLSSSHSLVSGGAMGSSLEVDASETIFRSYVEVQRNQALAVDMSTLHVVEATNAVNRRAGLTIEQQGATAPPGSSNAGDAVLHWRFRDQAAVTSPPDRFFSMGIDATDLKWKLSVGEQLGAGDIITYDPATGITTIRGFTPGASAPPTGLTASNGVVFVGSDIQADSSVARTTTTITGVNGLTGGGNLAASRTLDVRLQTASGLVKDTTGLAISNSLAGSGLVMNPTTKVLSVDSSALVPTTKVLGTTAPIIGGGPLSGPITIALQLAATNPGLRVTGGALEVDPSVVRITRTVLPVAGSGLTGGGDLGADITFGVDATIIAKTSRAINTTAPLSGGGDLTADRTLQLLLGTTLPGLKVTSGRLVVDYTQVVSTATQVLPGSGLTGGGALSTDVTLAVNYSQVVSTSRQIITPGSGGVQGGGPLSGDLTLTVDGTVVRTSLNIFTLAGSGLIGGGPLTGSLNLAVDSSVVRTSVTLTAGNGLTGGGTLAGDVRFDVVPTDGTLNVNANDMAVNQGFNFAWIGAQTWGAAVTQTFAGPVSVNGVMTFNATPNVAANLNFVGTRSITSNNNLTLAPTGSLIQAPTANLVLPNSTSIVDLGAYNRKYRTLYVSELVAETLVAQSVVATIGGRVMVAPTTVLMQAMAAVNSGGDVVFVKHNGVLKVGGYLFMETAPGGVPQFEVMSVDGVLGVQPDGSYEYQVTRNKDGSGGNAWAVGDAVVFTGDVAGTGYIDLTSTQTIHGHSGPTVTIYSRTSAATWNSVAPVTTMGNLKGFVDYVSDEHGFAVGDDLTKGITTFNGMTVDRTKGLRLFNVDVLLYTGGHVVSSFGQDTGVLFQYEANTWTNPTRGIYWTSGNMDGPGAPTMATVTAIHPYRDVNGQHVSFDSQNAGNIDIAINAYNTTSKWQATMTLQGVMTAWGFYDFNSVGNPFQGIRIEQGGNTQVGWINLGGKSTASRLHVWEQTNTVGAGTGVLIENFGSTGDVRLAFKASNGALADWAMGMDRSNSNAFSIAPNADLGTSPIVTLTTGGQMGLGTNAPASARLLHMKWDQASANSYVQFENLASSGAAVYRLVAGPSAAILDVVRGVSSSAINVNTGDLTLQNTISGNINLMPFGNVGINQPLPTSLLHLKKDQAATTSVSLENLNASGATLFRSVAGASNAILDIVRSSTSSAISANTGDLILQNTLSGNIALLPFGNVGVSQANPLWPLHVTGQADGAKFTGITIHNNTITNNSEAVMRFVNRNSSITTDSARVGEIGVNGGSGTALIFGRAANGTTLGDVFSGNVNGFFLPALLSVMGDIVVGRTTVLDGSGLFVTHGSTILEIANTTSATNSTQYPVLELTANRPSGTPIGTAVSFVAFTNSAMTGTEKRLALIGCVTGPSNLYGQLLFYTTNNSVLSEAGRFRNDNVFQLQAGVNFAGNTANLSYYDEGTWTPSYSAGGTGVTQSNQKGFWTRVGNRVDCWYSLSVTAKGTGTGTVIISGFPFAANTNSFASGAVYFGGAAVNISSMVAWMNQGAATMTPYAVVSGTTTTMNPLAGSQMGAAHSYAGYVCYFI
jgi:hypothetical protein